MTDRELATLLREDVARDEPPFLMTPHAAVALGRRTLLRRRARRGFAGVLVAAAAAAAVPLLPWGAGSPGGDDRTGLDAATAYALEHYDAQAMPALLEQRVATALGDGLTGLGPATFAARDDQGVVLPERYYDKASSMEVTYGGEGDRRVRVALLHSRSEAEGDARKRCESDVEAGYAFSCDVTTAPNGDTVTTSVTAVRPLDRPDSGWGAVTREELRTGTPAPGDPSQRPIDRDEVYFVQTVESVHSDTFLTSVQEIVKAPTLARAAFAVSPDRMTVLVTDPALVIPKPPTGDNGCGWQLHPEGITCSRDPS